LLLKKANAPYARYAWGVLAYNIAVVLWGAYVRATGSGAGCGNHWPLCNGELILQSPGVKTLIEFTHRAMTGLDGPLVAILVIWAFRAFPRHDPVRLGATLSGVFLVTEALMGALLVKLEHVASNPSTARGYTLTLHLLNTLTLLACLALTAWWAGGKPALRVRGRAAWLAAVSAASIVLLGMSGVIAALGDTLFPARSLAEGLAQDLDPAANIFLKLRLLHPVIAAAAGVWLAMYGVGILARNRGARAYVWAMLGILAIQILTGSLNLLLLAPVWIQMVHLLLADLLWISLVLTAAVTLAQTE
jgi:heme A synthase